MMRRRAGRTILYLSFSLFLIAPFLALAVATPELVATETTNITKPDQAQAYYGTLKGEPHRYIITSDKAFPLRIRVIMADVPESKRDISVAVLDSGATDEPLALLDGMSHDWKQGIDANGQTYLEGPAWNETLEAGNYELRVWSGNNDSSYGLIIGQEERGLSPIGILIALILLALAAWGIYTLTERRRRDGGGNSIANTGAPAPKPPLETSFFEKREKIVEQTKEIKEVKK